MTNSNFSGEKVFSVTELNTMIRDVLEGTFPVIKLEGEISGFKPHSSGHLYFSLKDSTSLISAVMFRGSAQYLQFAPKDGMKVQVSGKISVYPPQGKYQLVITKMSIAGEGAVLKMLEERKRKLFMEGLFAQEHKRKLPFFPRTIGVVTSPTGAALRDILQITKRRNPGVNVIVFPCLVQGEGAAKTIVDQIKNANAMLSGGNNGKTGQADTPKAPQVRESGKTHLCDVLIVGRGGGSLEDLLPFSEESVVRAIYESEIPVISAVGHEIDWALSDYAADKRAATPSAAAELAVPLMADLKMQLSSYKDYFYTTLQQKVERTRLLLRGFNPESLEIRFRAIQQPLLNRFANAKTALPQNLQDKIRELRNTIAQGKTILENASPKTIFERGYSMVVDKATGKVVRDAATLSKNSELEITPASGKITATVTAIQS